MTKKIDPIILESLMIETVVLSIALVERFEIMEEEGYVAHKTKQSVKTAAKFLKNYTDKVFDVSNENISIQEDMKKGASSISELSMRLHRSLQTENLMNISERKEILREIISKTVLFEIQQKELYEKIRDSGILDY